MMLKDASILLVDDEPELLEFFQLWFVRAGSRVLTAGNGARALELAQQQKVDLVISDVRMPVMDGVELARRLKQIRYIPKLIFVSGFADIENRELYELGVEAKLQKPMKRQVLLDRAQRCLSGPEKRWAEPPSTNPSDTIAIRFDSLAMAQESGRLAFGRGGFCLRYQHVLREDEPVGLAIKFTADRQAIFGHGIVRWTDTSKHLLGIEITQLDAANLTWVVQQTGGEHLSSFIPAHATGLSELATA